MQQARSSPALHMERDLSLQKLDVFSAEQAERARDLQAMLAKLHALDDEMKKTITNTVLVRFTALP